MLTQISAKFQNTLRSIFVYKRQTNEDIVLFFLTIFKHRGGRRLRNQKLLLRSRRTAHITQGGTRVIMTCEWERRRVEGGRGIWRPHRPWGWGGRRKRQGRESVITEVRVQQGVTGSDAITWWKAQHFLKKKKMKLVKQNWVFQMAKFDVIEYLYTKVY